MEAVSNPPRHVTTELMLSTGVATLTIPSQLNKGDKKILRKWLELVRMTAHQNEPPEPESKPEP